MTKNEKIFCNNYYYFQSTNLKSYFSANFRVSSVEINSSILWVENFNKNFSAGMRREAIVPIPLSFFVLINRDKEERMESYSSSVQGDWVLCGVGGFGLLALCKDKEGVIFHLHPPEPIIGETTADEVRQYVNEMEKYHTFLSPVAYFLPPEEYWAGEMEEARIKMEQTGSRLLSEHERIVYLGAHEALFCQTFSGRMRVYSVTPCLYQYLGYGEENPGTEEGYLVDLSWDGVAGHTPERGHYFLVGWNEKAGELVILSGPDDDYAITWEAADPLYSKNTTASGYGCGPVDNTAITRRNRLIRSLRRRLNAAKK